MTITALPLSYITSIEDDLKKNIWDFCTHYYTIRFSRSGEASEATTTTTTTTTTTITAAKSSLSSVNLFYYGNHQLLAKYELLPVVWVGRCILTEQLFTQQHKCEKVYEHNLQTLNRTKETNMRKTVKKKFLKRTTSYAITTFTIAHLCCRNKKTIS